MELSKPLTTEQLPPRESLDGMQTAMHAGSIATGPNVSYLDNPGSVQMLNLKYHKDGTIDLSPSTQVERQQTLDTIQSARQAIFEMPTHNEGLNFDRIYGFTDSIGAPRKEVRVLSPEDYARAAAIVGKKADATHGGQYLPLLDTIIISRDPEKDKLNGPEYTESNIVHELAHADANHRVIQRHQTSTGRIIKKTQVEIHQPRTGFIVEDHTHEQHIVRGVALEEGYADYWRGRYVKDVLGRPGGFTAAPGQLSTEPLAKVIPAEYTHYTLDKDGKHTANFSGKAAISAAIIDALASHDPELIPAMQRARKTEDGLREVAQRIDAISPGLYRELSSVAEGKDGDVMPFVNLYRHIRDDLPPAPQQGFPQVNGKV